MELIEILLALAFSVALMHPGLDEWPGVTCICQFCGVLGVWFSTIQLGMWVVT